MNTNLYRFRVSNVRVIDGDTVDVNIDLGFDVWTVKQRVRFFGLDAPEVRTRDLAEKAAGFKVKEYVEGILTSGVPIILESNEFKPKGKFGRILGTFWYQGANDEWYSLSEQLIRLNMAVPYDGGKRG